MSVADAGVTAQPSATDTFCIIGGADPTPVVVAGPESERLYRSKRRVNYHGKENQSDHAWL